MKRIFIAATAILLGIASVQAQEVKKEKTDKKEFAKGHHKGQFGGDRFAKLNLTDAQKKQAKDLNENYRKQFADLRKNTSMPVGDYRAKTAVLRKEQHEKMQSLLTPEQKTQMAAQKQKGAERMKEGRAKNFDRMKTQLGLTDEQTKKIKDNQAGLQSKLKDIRANTSLTPDQKKEQARAIFKQQQEQLKSVLTPEQLQKMKAGRRNKGINS